MKHHPYQRFKRTTYPEVGISEQNDIRALHLGSSTIQSAMNLNRPEELVLSYSQAMMAWCLFTDNAQHITHIGLGGGSMVRWIHTWFPHIKQLAIEINPQVIRIARSHFHLPEENAQFHIIEADGTEYIRIFSGSTDVILVDGFDGEDIIESLTEEAFFANCANALSEQGIFVANWWSADGRYPVYVSRLKQVFANRVLEIPAQTHGNMAVLAFKNKPPYHTLNTLKKRAEQYQTQTKMDFAFLYKQIHDYGKHNGQHLFVE